MLEQIKQLRSAVLVIISALALAFAAVASADDTELVDVSKKTSQIQKKMDQLRSQGRWARQGRLWAAAVCGDESATQTFAPWGDMAEYVPAPQGDIENADDWDVNDHASVVEGNSPFSNGSHSLLLTEGAEATTPVLCISTLHPTIRFFARNSGSSSSRLEVSILYEDFDGHTKALKIARLRNGEEWAPSLVVPIYMNMLAAASENGVTAVALRFKAKDVKSKSAGWQIDDLLVDPWKDT